MSDLIDRQQAIDALMEDFKRIPTNAIRAKTVIEQLPSAQPEQRWIPVTKDTLPEEGKVVIVKGTKGTWDVGMYRGYGHFHGEERIHIWNWKKNTTKRVYWWMYKDGALPEPYGGEQK